MQMNSTAKRIDLTDFQKRSDVRSSLTVMAHLVLVLVPVYLAAVIGPGVSWIFLWLLFGLLMNGWLNLMHECAHYHVFHARRDSDRLGRWLLGPMLITDFDGYRKRHWQHHTHLGVDGDTKDAYLIEIRGAKLLELLIRCLFLMEAARKFRHQTAQDGAVQEKSSSAFVWGARTALFHSVLLGSLWLAAGFLGHRSVREALLSAGLAYGIVYGYALASITTFAAALRAIAEHQRELEQEPAVGRAALRNFRCGPLMRLVFGSYGFAEHATHHREPGLPYYHLPEATAHLSESDPGFAPRHGYLGTLKTLTHAPLHPAVWEPR